MANGASTGISSAQAKRNSNSKPHLGKTESFTAALAKLEADATSSEYAAGADADMDDEDDGGEGMDGGTGKRGGHIETSDAWPRPRLPRCDAKKDKIGELIGGGGAARGGSGVVACQGDRPHLHSRPPASLFLLLAVFQQIDIEEANDPSSPGGGTVLRLFGVTKRGNSVLAHVHGFRPYFYVAAPKGFIERDCDGFKDKLNVRLPPAIGAGRGLH